MGELELDERSDIYSVGAVAYFLLTGQPPFSEQTVMKVLLAHAHQRPNPPSSLASGIPQDLEAVVMRCLAKRPEERFADVGQLIEALEALVIQFVHKVVHLFVSCLGQPLLVDALRPVRGNLGAAQGSDCVLSRRQDLD